MAQTQISKPLTDDEKKRLIGIQKIIDDAKRKAGHVVQLPLYMDTTREIVRDVLGLEMMPARGIETERLILLIEQDPKLFGNFVDVMVQATNGLTRPGRLAITEKAIAERLGIFLKRGPFHVLDVGVGATDSEEMKAVTTIELAGFLACRAHNVTVFGGDIRLKSFEETQMWGARVVLFPFDLFNPMVYLEALYNKHGFDTFDIIRCSNLLGHFSEERRKEALPILRVLARNTSLLIYNDDYENTYTVETRIAGRITCETITM
ncbi:MAG: hypothetical protein N3H30_01130 [Candidatus Micrarchaeota archaeon]|nr:hypothetical protein [Candidatus Micrarchaeota archaeon]